MTLATEHLQVAKKQKLQLRIASGLRGALTLPAISEVVCITSWVLGAATHEVEAAERVVGQTAMGGEGMVRNQEFSGR